MVVIRNSNKTTKQLRHVDIRFFSLLEWVQRGDMFLFQISTSDNPYDSLTKVLGLQLHHRHNATMLGKYKPSFCAFWHLLNTFFNCILFCFSCQSICKITACRHTWLMQQLHFYNIIHPNKALPFFHLSHYHRMRAFLRWEECGKGFVTVY